MWAASECGASAGPGREREGCSGWRRRGLFRVEMTWAAPGGGGVGCTGARPGKARAGPPLFIPGRAFSKASARCCGRRFLHRGSRFLKRLPPQPAFFIPEPTSPKRAAARSPPRPRAKVPGQKASRLFAAALPAQTVATGPGPGRPPALLGQDHKKTGAGVNPKNLLLPLVPACCCKRTCAVRGSRLPAI